MPCQRVIRRVGRRSRPAGDLADEAVAALRLLIAEAAIELRAFGYRADDAYEDETSWTQRPTTRRA
jgi:hypothetical protein